MSKTLHIYSRVSTEEQTEGYSIENQQRLGKEYSNKEGFSSTKIWNEGGQSGSGEKIEDRKVLTKLLDKVLEGEVKDIFVQDISRLSRNSDVSHDILRILRDTKSTLHTNTGKISFSSHEDVLRYNILSSIGEYENNLRKEKIIQGIKSRFLDGKGHSWSNNFGYTTDKITGKLVPDEEEKQLYLRIVQMTMDGLTPYTISEILNQEGVPTPTQRQYMKLGKELSPLSKRGNLWTYSGVDRILKSPMYRGVRYYRGKNKNEKIETNVPQLIDQESWSLLQETIKNRVKTGRKRQRRNPINHYLLKGLCKCRKCGGTLWGVVRRKNGKIDHQVYFCKSKDKREERKRGKCNLKGINVPMLENVVWDKLIDTLSNSNTRKEEVKKKILGENKKERKEIRETLRKEISSITYQINNNGDKIKNLTKQLIEERVDEELFDEMKSEIDRENDEIKNRLLDKKHHLSLIDNDKRWINWLSSFESEIDGLRELNTTKERQPTIDKYISEIWVDYDEETKSHDVSIYLRFPIVDDSFTWDVEGNDFVRDENGKRIGRVEEGGNRIRLTGIKKPHVKRVLPKSNNLYIGFSTPSGKKFYYEWCIHLKVKKPKRVGEDYNNKILEVRENFHLKN